MPKLPYRVRQVLYYSNADRSQPPELPADVRARLTESMEIQFRILSTGDQEHLIQVYRDLESRNADEDTVTAGLLHDVGKACRKCNITIVDRFVHVFLSRVITGPYRRFARRETVPPRLMGLHRLASHARRGALAARQAGYNERVAWMIEHHEHGGDPDDAGLRLLRESDTNAGAGDKKP